MSFKQNFRVFFSQELDHILLNMQSNRALHAVRWLFKKRRKQFADEFKVEKMPKFVVTVVQCKMMYEGLIVEV